MQKGLYQLLMIPSLVYSCNARVLEQNLAAWEEAKKSIEEISDHPNTMPAESKDSSGAAGTNGHTSAATEGQ